MNMHKEVLYELLYLNMFKVVWINFESEKLEFGLSDALPGLFLSLAELEFGLSDEKPYYHY